MPINFDQLSKCLQSRMFVVDIFPIILGLSLSEIYPEKMQV